MRKLTSNIIDDNGKNLTKLLPTIHRSYIHHHHHLNHWGDINPTSMIKTSSSHQQQQKPRKMSFIDQINPLLSYDDMMMIFKWIIFINHIIIIINATIQNDHHRYC
ncbi:hypothetical protein DERF_012098 [Dermatophagoides farinae]|uniref:Uncharacterized protein n=1 Tax=Dermatophagoides farinae TaxID=6954 RepID=A0A922HR69_DERFA|nr:hypothetical protein DERF_012098 [Dermatophagoides farinae]